MSFAAEIKDFVSAYSAVSGALNERSRTSLYEEDMRSRMSYRDWLMGAQDRENASIIDFARSNDPLSPLTPERKAPPGGGDLASNQSNFIQQMMPFAQQVAEQTGMDPHLVIAQSALETGWGKSAPGNNFFGIKGPGQQHATTEVIDGQEVGLTDSFRAYADPGESFADYANFLQGDRYAGVLQAGTAEEQAQALQDAGYATDPDYANKLIDITNTVRQYASLTPDAAVAEMAGGAIPNAMPQVGGYNDISGRARISQSDAAQGVGQTMAQPRGMIIHHTGGGGTAEDVMDVLNERGFSVQYIIDREGNIHQSLPEGTAGQHMKTAQNDSGLDNSNAFGVEIIAADDSDVLPVQIEAAQRLATDLGQRYGFDMNSVFGHGEVNPHKQATEGAAVMAAIRGGQPIMDAGTAPGEYLAMSPQEQTVSGPPAEAGVDMGAVPEEAGFDPLPQTSGYTDPVSRAGSEDVIAALDERPPTKDVLAGALDFGRKILGAKPRGAVATDDDDPGGEAMADAVGAAPVDLVKGIEQAIRERDPSVTPEQMPVRVMGTIYNWWMRKGDPEKARGAVFSIYQTYKQLANQTMELAKMDAEDGDFDGAIEKFAEAYKLIPDGEVLDVQRNEDGSYNIRTRVEETGEVIQEQVNLDPRRIVSELMGISPDDFDELVEENILGAQPEQPNYEKVQTGLETLTEGAGGAPAAIPSEPGPVVPVYPDEAVPTTPTDETESPMGVEIPSSANEVDEGIQVASLDETAGVTPTGGAAKVTVPMVPPPIESEPLMPVPLHVFQDWVGKQGFTQQEMAYAWSQYNAQRKVYDDWRKTRPTAEQQQAAAAYDEFYKRLTATPPDQFFDRRNYDLFRGISDQRVVNAMRGSAESRDAALQLQIENARKDREAAIAAGEEAEAEQSTNLMQNIEQDLFGPEEAVPTAQPVTPGPMPADYRLATSEAVPTGIAPVPEEEIAVPAEAGALEREDYTTLRTNIEQENVRIADRNKTRFTPREPLDLANADVQGQRDEIVTTGIPAYMRTAVANAEAAGNVEAQATLKLLETNIQRKRLGGLVSGSVMEFLRTPGNVPSEDEAVGSILSMLTVFAEEPDAAPYTARYVDDPNMPAGLVEVTVGDDPPFYIPSNIYDQLDAARAEMAREQLGPSAAARASGDIAQSKADKVAAAKAARDAEGAVKAEQYYERPWEVMPPAPEPVDPLLLPEYQ